MDIQTLRMLSAAANAPSQQSLLAALSNSGGQQPVADAISSPQGQGLLALLASPQSGNAPQGAGAPIAMPQPQPRPTSPPPSIDPRSLQPLPQQVVQGTNLPADASQAIQADDQGQSPASGGLLGALMPAAQEAAQSPDASKSLLGALGSTVSSLGDKLGTVQDHAPISVT